MNVDQWVEEKIDEAREACVQMSKKDFKKRLILEEPKHMMRIRQLVNMAEWWPIVAQAQATRAKPCTEASSSQAPVEMHSQSSSKVNGGVDLSSAAPSKQSVHPILTRMKGTKVEEFQKSLSNGSPTVTTSMSIPPLSIQEALLSSNRHEQSTTSVTSHALSNAILFSTEAYQQYQAGHASQFALFGSRVLEPGIDTAMTDGRIFLNTNIPSSTFVCGLQGSGKSHTTSCIIENCMIKCDRLGVLQTPASTLILHYGEYSTAQSFRPCDFAFLSNLTEELSGNVSRLSVTVLVSPSNYPNMRGQYTAIPGVTVRPFLIKPAELTTVAMLSLMGVSNTEDPPMYINQVKSILQRMHAEDSGPFCYETFRMRLEETTFSSVQRQFLNQRLEILESFIDLSGKSPQDNFAPGQVTIMDLSCPFVDENTACLMFNIGMSTFMQSTESRGKLVVLDEAHKYMHDTPGAKSLTLKLLRMVREQRHLGLRVVVATQEPYVLPQLIDLCTMVVVHRFSSPAWLEVLKKHIATDAEDMRALFKEISELRTGEAIVFAPTAVLSYGGSQCHKSGARRFKVAVRKRITWDSGRSILSV